MFERMLFKTSVLGLLEWWIHRDIKSYFPDDMTQVHATQDCLDATSYDLDQVLKY